MNAICSSKQVCSDNQFRPTVILAPIVAIGGASYLPHGRVNSTGGSCLTAVGQLCPSYGKSFSTP